MKVYKMNEYDWVATSLSKEATNKWYKKEIGLTKDNQPIDQVMECDTKKDGMYIEITFEEGHKILNRLNQEYRVHGSKELRFVSRPGFGLAVWVTFETVLKEHRYKTDTRDPFIIASTEF